MSSWLRMSWKHPARRRVMSILRSAAPSRTAPESEVIEPPSNAATTGRPSTGGNAKSSELHSVCIGAPYGFEKSRVGNRFLSDSQPRCTCFGEKSALAHLDHIKKDRLKTGADLVLRAALGYARDGAGRW